MSSDFFCDVCFRGQQTKVEKKPQSDSLTHSSSQKGREEDEDDVMMSLSLDFSHRPKRTVGVKMPS